MEEKTQNLGICIYQFTQQVNNQYFVLKPFSYK